MLANMDLIKFFLGFLFFKAMIQSYLDLRQQRSVRTKRNEVPKVFENSISLEDHQKAADYTLTKLAASKFFRSVNLVILLLWTVGGGLQALNNLVQNHISGVIWQGLSLFGLFGAISFVLSLPQELYHTFIIEERFGFNKTTMKIFILDTIKSLIIGVLLGAPLLSLILWIMNNISHWWFYAWLTMTAFQFVLIWAYPVFIAPLFNKFSPLEDGELKEIIFKLLEDTGFKSKGLFVMDASKRSRHGNAYFTGFGANKRIVFFDNLIKDLTPLETKAVLAHELGHFKKKHILKGMVKALVLGLCSLFLLSVLIKSDFFFKAHGILEGNNALGLLLFSLVFPIYTFILTPLGTFFSRKYEFEADRFASEHANAKDLITALVKMYKENASTLTPDEVYSNFYASHPPASIRINHLEKLQSPS